MYGILSPKTRVRHYILVSHISLALFGVNESMSGNKYYHYVSIKRYSLVKKNLIVQRTY